MTNLKNNSYDSKDMAKHLEKQVLLLKSRSPELHQCIDFDVLNEYIYSSFWEELISHSSDFEEKSQGGRGESYCIAQQNLLVRATGIQTLFSLASSNSQIDGLSTDQKILDVLGGDGLLTRVLSHLIPPDRMPHILTSDISGYMISKAQEFGLATFQQPAQQLILKDNCLDAIIIAYGTHHIPPHQRFQACSEAYRVLKPQGRIVLHDFEIDSPVSHWFNEVVDRYSLTKHPFMHFSRKEMISYLTQAGFEEVQIHDIYDPFILQGSSSIDAQQRLGNYLYNMYGLELITGPLAWKKVYELANHYFSYDYRTMNLDASFCADQISCQQKGAQWQVEMPRVALVATGRKPL